jgi:hypothetical protein
MTHRAWAGAAALCFALVACDHPAGSAASTPSADSFRIEAFEVRIGEARENVNGASVTSAFFKPPQAHTRNTRSCEPASTRASR